MSLQVWVEKTLSLTSIGLGDDSARSSPDPENALPIGGTTTTITTMSIVTPNIMIPESIGRNSTLPLHVVASKYR